MNHTLFSLFLSALSTLSVQAQQPTKALSFHSTDGDYWKLQTETLTAGDASVASVTVRSSQPQQTIQGWGTCFNELDHDAWSLLSEQDRQLFMARVFNPKGDLRFNVGRIPVGASDYGCDWYSCDETPQTGTDANGYPVYETDFEMRHFTIERDLTKVIPSIKAAQAQNPDMTFWASPWSPPSWMKTNQHYSQRKTDTNGGTFNVPPYDNDQFIDDPRYYDAYCLYFDKFIQAYKEQGIDITALAYQNEAYSNTPYPGCSWTAATTGKFLAQYLGPYMAAHQPDVRLIVGTMNTNRREVFSTILGTADISRYASIIGFQWEGGQVIGDIRRDHPNYELWQTESECGNGSFDWAAAEHTFQLCNHYLANGVTTYNCWNAILKDRGISPWGWVQNALVRVNSGMGIATYCPEYYAYKHYSHLIGKGSRILTCDEANLVTSALTPDGNIVVVVGNSANTTKTLTLDVDGQLLTCTLQPKSFATYVVGTEQTLTTLLRDEASGLLEVESASLTDAQVSTLQTALSAGTYAALSAALSGVASYADYAATPASEGIFCLYDTDAHKFLHYKADETNNPQLSVVPTRLALTANADGTYGIRLLDRPQNANWLKIGLWQDKTLWTDGKTATDTRWTFTPVPERNNTYIVSTSAYSETQVSGTYYLTGANASPVPEEAHAFVLVSLPDYIAATGNATPLLTTPSLVAKSAAGEGGWKRDQNKAAGYAEIPAAIQSEAHNAYGVSHWNSAAVTNSKLIYQTLSGLPAGKYSLSAYAAATVWNNDRGNDNRAGVNLFLSGSTTHAETPVTTPSYGLYSVDYELPEGEPLTLGLQADASNQNTWMFLSDVVLTYQPSVVPLHIADVPASQADARLYDLNGRYLGTDASAHFLPRQIYIRGGKKILFK